MELKALTKGIIVLMLIVVISGALSPIFPESSAQAGFGDEVYVIPAAVNIDLSPRGCGMNVTTIIVTNSNQHTIKVEIATEVPGYRVSPEKVIVAVPPHDSTSVDITIQGTLDSPNLGRGKVTVTLICNGCSQGTAETGFFVLTEPQASITLWTESTNITSRPGESVSTWVVAENHGNGLDTMNMGISNKEELKDAGFSVTFTTNEMDNMTQGENRGATLEITSPDVLWMDEYFNLEINATSQIDSKYFTSYSIMIHVQGVNPDSCCWGALAIMLVMGTTFLLRRRVKGESRRAANGGKVR
jgi:hypothetical protein